MDTEVELFSIVPLDDSKESCEEDDQIPYELQTNTQPSLVEEEEEEEEE